MIILLRVSALQLRKYIKKIYNMLAGQHFEGVAITMRFLQNIDYVLKEIL